MAVECGMERFDSTKVHSVETKEHSVLSQHVVLSWAYIVAMDVEYIVATLRKLIEKALNAMSCAYFSWWKSTGRQKIRKGIANGVGWKCFNLYCLAEDKNK